MDVVPDKAVKTGTAPGLKCKTKDGNQLITALPHHYPDPVVT